VREKFGIVEDLEFANDERAGIKHRMDAIEARLRSLGDSFGKKGTTRFREIANVGCKG
jgi:hypothetical protein